VALTRRILLLLEDDPQAVLKRASAAKTGMAHNDKNRGPRIRMHSW
jgi:hypothetical protein